MSLRELVVLGTAGQVPTRTRNHNGYLLRWDAEGFLFDPGEGTQRQLTLAGVAVSAVTRICITHFHGDHCLGLPGVIHRLSLDPTARSVDVWFPASGIEHFERLRGSAVYVPNVELRPHPVSAPGTVGEGPGFRLVAGRLRHRVETYGWRVQEPDVRRMLPGRLEAAGVRGPDVGLMIREGEIRAGGRLVRIEDVSEIRRGQVFAFLMDTAVCDEAIELARGADLLVCESTYLAAEQALATAFGHLTATDAARIAAEAGAARLVLTHFSQRYPDESVLAREAAEVFADVVAAHDLMRVPMPRRRPPA